METLARMILADFGYEIMTDFFKNALAIAKDNLPTDHVREMEKCFVAVLKYSTYAEITETDIVEFEKGLENDNDD